jgi:ornithine cyclodeaminase/alanine dehydrogenase
MMARDLIVLSRRDVAQLMSYGDYVDTVEAALLAASEGRALAAPAAAFHLPSGSFHAKAALTATDPPTIAIKLNGNYPDNPVAHGLPTVQGIIYLAHAANGQPLALMDSIEITINRTAAATTLAARHLARKDSRVATICGAGVQGRIQLRAITAALALERAYVWDARAEAAHAFAQDLAPALKLEVQPARSLGIVRQSDVVVACTSARRAFLTPDLVRPGTFIAAVGADNSDKQEIDPRLYAKSLVVVDSLEQAAEIGDLHHALVAGTVGRDHVHATLGAIVSGRRSGRTDAATITLFNSTGMGLQDVAAATAVWRRALEAGVGTRLNLN